MLKLVLFDLDGVLVDTKEIHFKTLNIALGEKYAISEEEHRNFYDGRKTRDKLKMLSERKGLPTSLHDEIFDEKQRLTKEMFSVLEPIDEIKLLFAELELKGYKIGVCTNSMRRTALIALAKINLIEHCSVILSSDDVHNPKPHPEIYWKAMSIMKCLPEETLIVEDSPIGLLAAERSRARYIRVDNPYDVTRSKVMSNLTSKPIENKWKSDKLNVLIPMAGAGTRFAQAGYTFPKPLIPVNGKPMIQVVIDNLRLEANFIFVVQKEHVEKYNVDSMLKLIVPNCKVVLSDGLTEGAACTALLAKEFIDNDNPLFFANSDQYVEWNPIEFMYLMQETQSDGGIVTFKDTHPKWSFAKVDANDIVLEVAEKKPISDNATAGYYYWKHGNDFVKYAEQMIRKNVRVNNEFYVCPVFNEAIQDKKTIRIHQAEKMWGLGTPEDLDYFLQYHKET
jgi:HAD superfamily hydrolase (TIGR01509 family)